MPEHLIYQEYAFIAFALMGLLVDAESACRQAADALKTMGVADSLIAQAQAGVQARIAAWNRP